MLEAAGVTFIGPKPKAMEVMATKIRTCRNIVGILLFSLVECSFCCYIVKSDSSSMDFSFHVPFVLFCFVLFCCFLYFVE